MVENVIDDYTFEVCNYYEKFTDKVFVFGRETTDFRVVDYNRVFVTGISAIQELSRQLNQLREANNAQSELLKQKADALQVTQLRNEVEELKGLLLKQSMQSNR